MANMAKALNLSLTKDKAKLTLTVDLLALLLPLTAASLTMFENQYYIKKRDVVEFYNFFSLPLFVERGNE